MATLESIAIRRAEHLDRAETAIRRISKATGAEIDPFPAQHKLPEMRQAVEAEWMADALEAIAKAIAPTKKEKDKMAEEKDAPNEGNGELVDNAPKQGNAPKTAADGEGVAKPAGEMTPKEAAAKITETGPDKAQGE